MATAEPRIDDPEAVKAEWVGRLDALIRDIKNWVEASGWKTKVYRKAMKEDPALGQYDAPRSSWSGSGTGSRWLWTRGAVRPRRRRRRGPLPDAGLDDVASLYYEDSRWVVHYAGRLEPAENHSVYEGRPCPIPKSRSSRSSTRWPPTMPELREIFSRLHGVAAEHRLADMAVEELREPPR